MEEAAPILHLTGRLIGISELLLSLSAGAILLIATLVRNPPQVKRAKWHVVIGLTCFTASLLVALDTIVTISTVEAKVLLQVQEAMLRVQSDTPGTGKPASEEPRAELKTQDNEKETEKQAEQSKLQIKELMEEAGTELIVTYMFFGLGLMAMLSLGMRIASSWKDKPAPSS